MSKSEMVTETRVMRSIAAQLEKLKSYESRARVLAFVNSVVHEGPLQQQAQE